MEQETKHLTFEDELETLINCHSIENESDTPDFILALYIRGCLEAWNMTTRARDKWYGDDNKINKRLGLDNPIIIQEKKEETTK